MGFTHFSAIILSSPPFIFVPISSRNVQTDHKSSCATVLWACARKNDKHTLTKICENKPSWSLIASDDWENGVRTIKASQKIKIGNQLKLMQFLQVIKRWFRSDDFLPLRFAIHWGYNKIKVCMLKLNKLDARRAVWASSRDFLTRCLSHLRARFANNV